MCLSNMNVYDVQQQLLSSSQPTVVYKASSYDDEEDYGEYR
jgi:hypothetical protein